MSYTAVSKVRLVHNEIRTDSTVETPGLADALDLDDDLGVVADLAAESAGGVAVVHVQRQQCG